MSFTVSLSQPSREQVTVDYHTSDGTATGGVDFRTESGTLTFPPGHDRNGVSLLVVPDQDPEPDETFTVTLTNPRGATPGDATATGTILDDGDTDATLTASDIEDTTATLTIGGHDNGWWYKGKAHSCTAVAAGTTAAGLSGLTAVTTYEYFAYSDSVCRTKLANVEFRTLAPEGTPTVSVSDAQVSEDGTYMRFKVTLSQPSRERVVVPYVLSSGTATMGTDFEGNGRWGHALHISANSAATVYSARVRVYDDQEPEPDETFTLTLTKAYRATLGDATATGTILDDGDTDATLSASDIEDTTATLSISGHTDGWWYKGRAHSCTAVAAGTTAVSISGLTASTTYKYFAYSDSACGTKLANVEFKTLAPETPPTVSVSNLRESEDSTQMTVTVSLSHPNRERVTVGYHTSGGTATSGTDFEATSGTLAFGPYSTSPARVPVRIYDDETLEPDETFTVTLTNPTGATLGYATATMTIENDDTAATLTASDIEDTTATLTISGHTDGWWYRGRDRGTSERGACTAVAAGTTSVDISGLTTVTNYEYFAYSDSGCRAKLANVEFRTIAPEGVTPKVSVSDAEASEDGLWMQFWVSLSEPTREEVTVDGRTSDGTAAGGTDFEAVSLTLTFPANSRSSRHLSVRIFDDQEREPDETFTVTLTNPVDATLGDATATGTIEDDGDTGDSEPSVAGEAVVSDPGGDATYAVGEKVQVQLTFGEAVDVDTEDGTPRLKLDLGGDDGAGERWAAYESGSGTDTLVFAHEVVEPNLSTQGIAVLANSLALGGGTIRSSASGAALAHTGLGHDANHKVDWRPDISVADARANEGVGATVAFEVSLSRAFTGTEHQVTVDYATADGTATAGEDYTATSGTLTFAAGESSKTVSVTVLDDSIDEGEETFTLRLSNATGARIADGEATGTIANEDPLQKMWLSRFGRTVASHVTDAVSDRLANPLSGVNVTVAGQSVDLAHTEDEARP